MTATFDPAISSQEDAETLAELLDYHPAMGLELVSGFWKGLSGSRVKN